MKILGMFLSLCVVTLSHANDIRAVIVGDQGTLWSQPEASGKPVAILKGGAALHVLSRTVDKQWLRVEARTGKNGGTLQGFVRSQDVLLTDARLAPVPSPEKKSYPKLSESPTQVDDEVLYPWSFGFGFSGYSTPVASYFLISGDARYAWTQWTESMLGLQLGLGGGTQFGAQVGERFYAPLDNFRPYAQIGYLRSDLRYSMSSAWVMGGGFQVSYGGGHSFFELGILYLLRTPFGPYNLNSWSFAGGSGIRF